MVPCPICQKENCACKAALLSYFSILDSVNARVLSAEPASHEKQPSIRTVGVDKLSGYFQCPIAIESVRQSARLIGVPVKRVFLKNRRPHLEIGEHPLQIHFPINISEDLVTGFVSNPNRFSSWNTFWSFFSSLIPRSTTSSAIITRADFNLDFACSFSNLIESIDIKHKQSSLTFLDDSGERTGLIVGKGAESIAIYDKAKKERIDTPLTRVELRLHRSKLGKGSLEQFPNTVQQCSLFESLIGVTVTRSKVPLSDDQQTRLSNFNSLRRRDGYYSAKKLMNQARNFDRDFSKIIKIEEWTIQPKDLFRHGIKRFFNKEDCQWNQRTNAH